MNQRARERGETNNFGVIAALGNRTTRNLSCSSASHVSRVSKMRTPASFALLMAAMLISSGAPARAAILVTIDKSAQQMTVAKDGALLYRWPVSTGRQGRDTPSGKFRAFRLERDHFSKEWDDAPMPFSIFFTEQGHAIHGSYEVRKIGTPVSAGCVRLHPDHAAKLFELVEQDGVLKTTVIITGQTPAPAVARRTLPRPAPDEVSAAPPRGWRTADPAPGAPLVLSPDGRQVGDIYERPRYDPYGRPYYDPYDRPRYPRPFPWD
jgi:L,D-transpeptidase catalytic domain